jgi:dUTP pyrophosphatase
MTINPGECSTVGTGIGISLPIHTYGCIAPPSGLATKHGIDMGAGVINWDYTGEIKVLLVNHSSKPFIIAQGDCIAQLILENIRSQHLMKSKSLRQPIEEKKDLGQLQ